MPKKSRRSSSSSTQEIVVKGAWEHNLKGVNLRIKRNAITVITGVSGSGKSSLVFDTILAESQRRFFYTLSHYTRQFLDLGSKPAVQQISGLSPAIALSQNETTPSRLATVGSLTDVSELLGVLFARYGHQKCPDHNLASEASSVESIAASIAQQAKGQSVAIFIPLVEDKKGHFASQMTKALEKGYVSAYVDGELVPLDPVPKLEKSEKHTIKLLVDVVKVKSAQDARLIRAVQHIFEHGEKHGEYWSYAKKQCSESLGTFSTASGCPKCGFSWPKLDSRYFSANSLGKCKACKGWGVTKPVDEEVEDFTLGKPCPSCDGTGLAAKMRAITLNDEPMHEFLMMPIADLYTEILKIHAENKNPAFQRVSEQIVQHLKQIVEIGLGYLNLSRRILSLSGGEKQRLRLANILGENLRGVLYVLDEPSQGLHPSEVIEVWNALAQLKENGNTLLIIDHDQQVIERADHIVDLGPGGGQQGGEVMAIFSPKHAKSFAKQSLTASFLSDVQRITPPEKNTFEVDKKDAVIELHKADLNNLNIPKVKFLKSRVNIVSGVSGAGKSSLARYTLYANLQHRKLKKRKVPWMHCKDIKGYEGFKYIHLIDRKPLARSSVSMPISYLDVLGDVRKLYASLPQAQVLGLTARDFSIHAEGGRCEECKGRGEVNMSMRFLSDARVKCSVCEGKRFRPSVLEVKYDQLSINDVFELTIDQALEAFKTFRRIVKKLRPAQDIGLGYLKLGQPSVSLSGGEAQRLKLVPFLNKTQGEETLLIIEEPTMGLHFQDVEKLIHIFAELAAAGTTLVIIEHNSDVIKHADWVVDLGPGAAEEGGQLVFQGVPEKLSGLGASRTAQFL